jgi:lactate dehydrogenase-like 2-hydroxyacid dehydrogenase
MDCQAVALKVLAHFDPGPNVLDFLAPETDWLDIRWCTDDQTFYRELPEADVVWHVLRPLSAIDLARATRARLVHKFGAGVNTIDVDAATEHGIAVANMPGANAPSVAEGTVLLMLAALRRLPVLDRATRDGRGWPSDPQLGETSATSVPAPSAWSATAASPKRSRRSSKRWAPRCYTAPATTACPAGGRCRNCPPQAGGTPRPPATSSRCTCR